MALLDEIARPRAPCRSRKARPRPGGIPAARPAAARPQGRAGRVRRPAPGGAEGAGRRGPGLWLRDLAGGHPQPKRKAVKTRAALELSPYMPLTRDFAFVVDGAVAAGDLVRAVQGAGQGADHRGAGVRRLHRPRRARRPSRWRWKWRSSRRDHTLAEAEIEALSARIIAAAEKAVGRGFAAESPPSARMT